MQLDSVLPPSWCENVFPSFAILHTDDSDKVFRCFNLVSICACISSSRDMMI